MTHQHRLPTGVCRLMLFLTLLSSSLFADNAENRQILASWVQYVTAGVEVRVVTEGACPDVILDGKSTPMALRAAPTAQHPNRVCSARVPAGTRTILMAGTSLPAPLTTTPQRIVVIGDSGCRVSAKHGLYQACNNSSIWPFEQISNSAAQSAPQLIIYTGDYIYRESPCPAGNKGCEGTPYGDNQATWLADSPTHCVQRPHWSFCGATMRVAHAPAMAGFAIWMHVPTQASVNALQPPGKWRLGLSESLFSTQAN